MSVRDDEDTSQVDPLYSIYRHHLWTTIVATADRFLREDLTVVSAGNGSRYEGPWHYPSASNEGGNRRDEYRTDRPSISGAHKITILSEKKYL